MKKFFILLVTCFTLVSCVVPAQVATSVGTTTTDYTYYDEYTYCGVSYPVVYFNSIPYFFFENTWMVISDLYRPHIHHFDIGRRWIGPEFHRPMIGGAGRGWSIGPRGNRPMMQPQRGSSTRITGPRSNGSFSQRPSGTFSRPGNSGTFSRPNSGMQRSGASIGGHSGGHQGGRR